ncbi:type II toxin-antitoxin system VapC family toxin [Candidatus Poriferisodalis sp.]|uniref:type II toxin-antitoxin system VapC family toxin n=1 Tax=Candidatus Poriferisodalis sp. TaxID=3101277 RepID=UPI003B01D648
MNEALVVDASAVVDILIDAPSAGAIRNRLRHNELHAPAHLDIEVMSALGRLHRAGRLRAAQVSRLLETFKRIIVRRHLLDSLLASAWNHRHNLRLSDALYAALSDQHAMPVVTVDRGMVAAIPRAEHPADA